MIGSSNLSSHKQNLMFSELKKILENTTFIQKIILSLFNKKIIGVGNLILNLFHLVKVQKELHIFKNKKYKELNNKIAKLLIFFFISLLIKP